MPKNGGTHMEDLNAVDDAQDSVVESPEETEVVEVSEPTPEGETGDVADPQQDKQVQSPEDNARFADVRRRAEREAEDRVYSQLYGDYGIKSKADYDTYVREQQQQQLIESHQAGEIDAETLRSQLFEQFRETDPLYVEAMQLKQENFIKSQFETFNTDMKEIGLDVSIKSVKDLDKLENSEKMAALIESGHSLSDAYFLANKQNILAKKVELAQQDVLKKTELLKGASPGSLDARGSENNKSVYALTKEEFARKKEQVLLGR